jgi:HEAT repeat protein
VFAGRALGLVGDRAAIPVLETMVREEVSWTFLRAAAAEGLARLGVDRYLCELVGMLGEQTQYVQNLVPSFLLEVAAERPLAVSTCLVRGLADAAPLAREVSAWVAGAARLAATAPALRAALADEALGVRIAAVWALGVLGDPDARPALEAAARDRDPELQRFAREALGRLEQAS